LKKNYLLTLLTAFLLWLAWPPIPFTAPLLLIAFVPLLIAVDVILNSPARKKGRKIFWLCLTAFFVWNTSCIYWIFNSFISAGITTWVALLISLIPFGLAALLMTLAFWLYYKLRRVTSALWSYTGLICFWIGYEYLHQSWDLAFPWMTLGNGFATTHQLIQWYEYTGVYGGTLWIWLCNIMVFELYKSIKNSTGNSIKFTLASVIIIALPIAASLAIYNTYHEKMNPANVVVVQPNIDPYERWRAIPSFLQVQRLVHLSDSIGQPNTEYFIWPETSIPDYINEEYIRNNVNFMYVQTFLSKYKNANVIAGIESFLLYDNAKTPTAVFQNQLKKYSDYFNTAIQIENSDKVQFYHKSKLVPGVEQMPFSSALGFMKPVFAAFGGSSSGFGRQDSSSVFYAQSGIGVDPIICYESIWGGYVAESVRKGAQFIAIITNDGWWGNTSGKDQHMDYAKLRAVETRRWVARSANTGISGFINQRGDIVKKSSWWKSTALKADINLNEELTFYVKYGDYIAWIACAGSGIFILLLLLGGFKKE